MRHDPYFESEEFLNLLHQYEENEAQGLVSALSSDDYVDIAQYYADENQITESRETIEKCMSLYPEADDPIVFRSRMALVIDHNPNESRRILDLVNDKDCIAYCEMEMELLVAANDIEKANQYIEQKLANAPTKEKFEGLLEGFIYVYFDYGEYEQTLAWIEKSSQKDTPDFVEMKAEILMYQGKYEESEVIMNKLLDENPYSAAYWNNLASSQLLNNHIEDSLNSSSFSLAINPKNTDALLNKAYALYELENYEDSLECYKSYASIHPNDENGYLLQGLCLNALGQTEEAEQTLLKGIEIAQEDSPCLIKIYQELAFIKSAEQKTEEALHWVDKMTETGSDDLLAKVMKGHVLLEGHYILDGVKVYNEVIKNRPLDNNDVLQQIGVSAYENGLYEYALMVLNHYLMLVPADTRNLVCILAVCYKKTGQRDSYLSLLSKCALFNEKEAKRTLGEFFPEDLPVKDYYQWAVDHPEEEN